MAVRRQSSIFYRELQKLMIDKNQKPRDLECDLVAAGYPYSADMIRKYRNRTPPPEFIAALARVGYTHDETKALVKAHAQDIEQRYLSYLVF